MEIQLPRKGRYKNKNHDLQRFSEQLKGIQEQIDFKVSSRGWCYQLEQFGTITKGEFDMLERIINECRELGYLPIDFVAEEEGRKFSGVEEPNNDSPQQYMSRYLQAALSAEEYYTPDWWKGETYYIQMLVEKIDLKTLFEPVCQEYHIPIATTKGWSSMLQRAEYARRFKEAEENGLQCVLLYCGDHDPDGKRISEFLRKNLMQLQNVNWIDGTDGYDPVNLTIDRFGLNFDFIKSNKLTWIDNLITGSGKNLASRNHPNHNMPYVQEYLSKFGARKCEANALVVRPEQARDLCREAIESYLGDDAISRFENKRNQIRKILNSFRAKTGLKKVIQDALKLIRNEN